MNSFKNSFLHNTLAINKNLTNLNKLYKERIELLEQELSNEDIDNKNNNLYEDSNTDLFIKLSEINNETHYQNEDIKNENEFFHKLKHFNTESEKGNITILEEIDLPIENTNDDKDTSLRLSKETKKALEEVRFDFIDHYREKMSYSQAISLLIKIYIYKTQ